LALCSLTLLDRPGGVVRIEPQLDMLAGCPRLEGFNFPDTPILAALDAEGLGKSISVSRSYRQMVISEIRRTSP
jgi:hypothetical protein